MRARYRCPNGTGVIQVDDDATIGAVFDALRAKTSIEHFVVKYGSPAAMVTIDLDQRDVLAVSLGLNGESVTVVPTEPRLVSLAGTISSTAASCDGNRPSMPLDSANDSGDVIVPWPEREGSLILRVMPSDNSCLFTAFGGALPQQLPASDLRQMMAQYILEHPDLYSEAILGCPPLEYRRSIQDPDRWGGGIELSILSAIFDMQICTFDVQGQHLINFGEEKQHRCVLVYSGIHYDRVSFSYTEYPHDAVTLPPELDKSIWPVDDSEVLGKVKVLVSRLNARHYYTDIEGLVVACNEIGCNWIGTGQLAARNHTRNTGHANLSEILDAEQSILRKCSKPGCGFIGQGEKMIRRHQDDTGHDQFGIIPDNEILSR